MDERAWVLPRCRALGGRPRPTFRALQKYSIEVPTPTSGRISDDWRLGQLLAAVARQLAAGPECGKVGKRTISRMSLIKSAQPF